MSEPKKKKTYAEKQETLRKVFCLVMAILMLLGVLAAVIPYIGISAHALDTPELQLDEVPADTAETKEPLKGLLLRIGLMFGSGVTPSYAISAPNGFVFGSVDNETDLFTPYFEAPDASAVICQDANLAIDENKNYAPGSRNVVIGGYHLELNGSYQTAEEIQHAVGEINEKLTKQGIRSSLIYAFPAYKNGELVIRIGDFGSTENASKQIPLLKTALNMDMTAVAPSSIGLTVLSPATNLILFEYSAKNAKLGMSARPSSNGTKNVITTPVKNTYAGVFVLDKYNNGISVSNLLEIDDYVAGVLPYEINNGWSYEALKAFAVIIRSYALANLDKHNSYGFDLCNGTECQAYLGTKNINDAVRRAVSETSGLVITYHDVICQTVYSAVTGGCTVDIEQIWNGRSYPYLRAVATPWEDYASHTYGKWTTTVSGYELYTYLVGKGYSALKGSVADVRILELANNSTYVYRLGITDIYGNSITLKGTDVIRTTLGRYLKSANFTVGHNNLIPVLDRPAVVLTADGEKTIPVEETDKKKTIQVMTADGVKTIDAETGLEVLQADGTTKTFGEGNYDLPEEDLEALKKAGSNFVFFGKGWGHGGGISQWGAKNMAESGASWDEIIHAYFTDVEIKPISDLNK
ncbi:MAG: SpoIID/LytB domain-containing protein [Clostridia bacterium]|nr:SpoIID/LytB domain-containing protein [Clostridia bacterium]